MSYFYSVLGHLGVVPRMIKYGLNNWNNYFPRENPRAPVIILYGDSWFWYPDPVAGNLSVRIAASMHNNSQVDLAVLGKNGLELRSAAKQMPDFIRLLYDPITSDYTKAVLLSLGGNDISSHKDLLKIVTTPAVESSLAEDYVDTNALEQLGVDLATSMSTIINKVNERYSARIPIIAHSYDYAVPSGKGILWFNAWLKPVLDARKVPNDIVLRSYITKMIVDVFHTSLTSIDADNFHIVDTRGTLRNDHVNDWSNELHPNKSGFNKLAWFWIRQLKLLTDLPIRGHYDL